MRAWQLAQDGSARWSSNRSRTLRACSLGAAARAVTLGGGGGGGASSSASSMSGASAADPGAAGLRRARASRRCATSALSSWLRRSTCRARGAFTTARAAA